MTAYGAAWLDMIFRLYPRAKGKSAVRGRAYLSTRRVIDVHTDGNIVRAQVIGSRRVSYHVTITVRPIAEDVWQAAVQLIARDQRYAGSIQQGVLLHEMVDIFDAVGEALLPQDVYVLSMQCDCAARGETCDHIMGVHMWIAAAINRDPFLLFTLRGRSKDAVLSAMAALSHNVQIDSSGDESYGGALGDTPAHLRYPSPPMQQSHQLLGPEAAGAAFDCWRAPVVAIPLGHEPAVPPDQLLAQLGDPPGWEGKVSLHGTLAPIYRGAAQRARSMLSARVLNR